MVIDENIHIEKINLLLKRNVFGQKLDNLIVEKGTNTHKLANDMGVTHTTVERYINGYPPKKKYAIRLCAALKLTSKEALDLLDDAGIVFSKNSNRDIVFNYIIKNIDFKKANVTDINILIDDLIKQHKNNYMYKRKIDQIELI